MMTVSTYVSNEESPLRQAVYKIDRKGKKTKLVRTGRYQQRTVQHGHEVLHEPLFQSEYSYRHHSE